MRGEIGSHFHVYEIIICESMRGIREVGKLMEGMIGVTEQGPASWRTETVMQRSVEESPLTSGDSREPSPVIIPLQ